MKSFFLLLSVCILGYFLAPWVLGIKSSSASRFRNQGEYLALTVMTNTSPDISGCNPGVSLVDASGLKSWKRRCFPARVIS